MFDCQICRSMIGRGIPSKRVVVETRLVRHPFRPEVHPIPFKKGKFSDDRGGVGPQIVREAIACPGCARLRMNRATAVQP